MTYLFKLARRMAFAHTVVLLSLFTLACSEAAPRDFLSPDPGTNPTQSSGAVTLVVSAPVSNLPYDQVVPFVAWGREADGDSVAVAVSWTASAGVIAADGTYRGTIPGTHTISAFAIGRPSLNGSAPITVSAPGPLFSSLTISPKPVTIGGGSHVVFAATARLQSGANTLPTVTWSATAGTITPGGDFTAPLEPGEYQVVATSLDGQVTDTARVFVEPPSLVGLQIEPRVATIAGGGSQDFALAASWSDGSSQLPEVVWLAEGGSIVPMSAAAAGGPQAAFGDRTWRFRAGMTPGNYKVVVRDTRRGKTDTASVTVTPVLERVEVTPGEVELLPGVSRTFAAKGWMTDDSQAAVSVSWTATGGTITGNGVYSAGSTPGTFRVIARTASGSLADTAVVRIAQPAATLTRLTVSPDAGTAPVGGQVTFQVQALWSDGATALPQLTWTAQAGSVSSQGVWTAPTTTGTYRVIVKHASGTVADTAMMNVVVPPPSLTGLALTPKAPAVQGGQQVTFSASASWSDGSNSVPPLQWSATGGTLNEGSRWTSPNVAGVYRVVARQSGGGLADTAIVTVAATPRVTALRVAPGVAALVPGATQQFNVQPTWSDGLERSTDVTWTATGGSISVGGLFTAGQLAGQALIIATCAGCAVADTAELTITEPTVPAPVVSQIVLNPSAVSMTPGEAREFSVAASWSDGSTTLPPLVWSVTGGTMQGLHYIAGTTAGTFKVIARHAGSAVADTSTVTITAAAPPPPVTPTLQAVVVTPATASVAAGQTQQFAAAGTMSDGSTAAPTVTWSATGGTVSASGLFTAPAQAGTVKVIATAGLLADTSVVTVTVAAPPSSSAVPLVLRRLDGGTGATQVSSGIPLPPGTLMPSAGGSVRVFLGGTEVPAYVEVLKGKHKDGSARSVLVQFAWPAGAGTQAAVEFNGTPTQPRLAKTAITALMPSAVALPTDPNYLVRTEVVGRTITRAATPTSIAMFFKYEADFDTWSNTHWGLYGGTTPQATQYLALNYYDRALSHFAFWARTGNPVLWERAALIAVSYRTQYLEANNFGTSEMWAQMDGLAVHYWLTGDDRSRQAVYKTAESLHQSRGGVQMTETTTHPYLDNRAQTKVLSGKVLAMLVEAPAYGTITNWAAAARVDLGLILSTQTAEGSYRFLGQCNQSSNFMTGLLNDAYVQYYENFEPDARIPAAIKKSIDWLWNTQWSTSAKAFNYYSGTCPNIGDATPTADLNGMFLEAWGWYYRHSGDAAYRNQAEQILQGGVNGAWLQATKQYNQHYAHSWRYLWYR